MSLISETLLAEEAFIERFLPQPNALNPNAPCDFGEGGCLYETYGAELDAIQCVHRALVWTLIDSDGALYLVSGLHFVDRLGYLLCAEPVPGGESFIVVLDGESDSDPDGAS